VSSRAEQVLDVYRDARVRDQLAYYENRRTQFERAHGQLLIVSAVLLGATSTVSALAGASIQGSAAWAAAAAILPAISTALVAYGALFAFERYAKLYGDAAKNLSLLVEPDLAKAADERGAEAAVRSYVEQSEKILGDEQAQWGQLTTQPEQTDSKPG
jgi:hypothetical protein